MVFVWKLFIIYRISFGLPSFGFPKLILCDTVTEYTGPPIRSWSNVTYSYFGQNIFSADEQPYLLYLRKIIVRIDCLSATVENPCSLPVLKTRKTNRYIKCTSLTFCRKSFEIPEISRVCLSCEIDTIHQMSSFRMIARETPNKII